MACFRAGGIFFQLSGTLCEKKFFLTSRRGAGILRFSGSAAALVILSISLAILNHVSLFTLSFLGEPEDPGAGAHDHLQVCGRGHPARPPRQLLPQQGRQDEHPGGGGGHAQRGQELAHQQPEAEQGRVGNKKLAQKNPTH